MKYCQQTTLSHPLSKRFPQHLSEINLIIREEGGGEYPFNKEVALKLDKVKDSSENPHIKKMKSMDMVLGIKDENNNLSSLIVDFKLDCKNAVNISESDCRDKIKHSKILLFGSGISVYNKYVFIFNNALLEISRRIISQRLTNASAEVLSINEFKANYF
ncbi:MAG: hypothetical protein A2033_00025 [Bacteroidetes bacterium GWA2_31_9]|nr:MAG: hypothetical protein A2033_00025 [Bacteroidetes bacterium GWA2_31_9]